MENCTFLLLLVLVTVFSSVDSRGYCNIRAQPNLIPEGLSGTWYLVKWKIPPGLPSTTGSYHYTWYMKLDPLTRRFDIIQTGRPRTPPYQCFENPATLTPVGLPYSKQDVYVWRTGGPILNDAEAVITDTDYSTYLVVYFCVPSFRPGCEIKVDVYTRFKRPNRRLVNFLDRLIARRLCLNPRTFFFTLLESYGVPRCPRPENFYTI